MTSERTRAAGSQVLRLFAVALGLGFVWFVSSTGDLNAGLMAVLAVAAVGAGAAALSASVRELVASIVALLGGSSAPRPSEQADLPATITQSRPDAPGRPRTRAPGLLPAVA